MKSIVNQNASNKSKPFPKLMISNFKGSIWLMISNRCGTLIHVGESTLSLGEQAETLTGWDFVDFEGSVTLSND